MHLDPTIHIENLITIGLAIIAIVFAWRDMDWRIKNLETWRTEQIDGLKARAVIDDRFQQAVTKFEVAIALLNSKIDEFTRHNHRS